MFRDKKKQILLCKAYLIITVIVVVAYVFDKTGMDHEFVLRLTGVTILFFTIPEIVQQSSLTLSEKLFMFRLSYLAVEFGCIQMEKFGVT